MFVTAAAVVILTVAVELIAEVILLVVVLLAGVLLLAVAKPTDGSAKCPNVKIVRTQQVVQYVRSIATEEEEEVIKSEYTGKQKWYEEW